MNFKKNGGFTLVELIVVIAILGILAGIGIPAYGNYVEKAQIAVEEQQISMYHNAYVVACVSNGIDPEKYQPVVNMTQDGVFTGLSGIQQRAGENPTAKAAQEFNDYFGFPGKPYTFKKKTVQEVTDGIRDGLAEGGSTSGSVKVEYTDKNGNKFEITLNQAQIDALNGSTFMTNAALGVDGLTDKLDFVTTFASFLFADDGTTTNESLNKVLQSDDYLRTFGGYLGIEGTANMTGEQVQQAILNKYMDEDGNPTISAEEQNKMMSNALVLYAAKNSTMDKNAATALLGTTGSDPKASILATLNGTAGTEADPATAMAQAALAYGMFTSYAYQSGDQTLINAANSDNPLNVMNYLNDDGFKAYINDENRGGKDLDGYLSAMGMITDGTQNNNVANDVLTQGFNNTQLESLLNGALGKTAN